MAAAGRRTKTFGRTVVGANWSRPELEWGSRQSTRARASLFFFFRPKPPLKYSYTFSAVREKCLANKKICYFNSTWVVEADKMLVKSWKFLDNVIPNSQISKVGDYFCNVCTLCSAYRPAGVAPSEEDEIEAQRMLRLSKLPNQLKERVEMNRWDKRKVVYTEKTADSCIYDPQLTKEE